MAWALAISVPARGQSNAADAQSKFLSLPTDKRVAAIKRSLAHADPVARQVGLNALATSYDVACLDALRAAAGAEKSRKLRIAMNRTVAALEAYKPIAVDGLALLPGSDAATAPAATPATCRLIGPATAHVSVSSAGGAGVGGASIRGISEEHGLLAPAAAPARTSAKGQSSLDIFPGRWTFLAWTGAAGEGCFVGRFGVPVAKGASARVALRPRQATTVRVVGPDGKGITGAAISAAYVEHLNYVRPVPVGTTGGDGRLRLWLSGDRPVEVLAVAQPGRGPGLALHGRWRPGMRELVLSASPGQAAVLSLSVADGEIKSTTASLALDPWTYAGVPMSVSGTLPYDVHVTPGSVSVAYGYQTAVRYALAFTPKQMTLGTKAGTALLLGGDLKVSLYHQYHPRHGALRSQLGVHVFVRDAGGSYLSRCAKTKRKRQFAANLAVSVRHGEATVVKAMSPGRRGRPRMIGGPIEGPGILPELTYEIVLPFAPQTPRIVKGHGVDFTKESEHYVFQAPRELAHTADAWLGGAEKLYAGFAALLRRTPTFRKGKSAIRFRPVMPPGVGAYAGGGNTTYTTSGGLKVTDANRIRFVPAAHEILHTFGHGHRDFMGLSCREVEVLTAGRRSAARLGRSRANQTVLRGGKVVDPQKTIDSALCAELGYDAFLEFFDTGRARRSELEAAGLGEMETNCAILDHYNDRRALPIYLAAHAAIDPARVAVGRKILAGKDVGGSPSRADGKGASPATSPGRGTQTRAIRRQIAAVGKAFEAGDRTAATLVLDKLAAYVDGLTSRRVKAYAHARTAEMLLAHDDKANACAHLKAAQRVAAAVSLRKLISVRGACILILKGERVDDKPFFRF